jgi:hypothetical protein
MAKEVVRGWQSRSIGNVVEDDLGGQRMKRLVVILLGAVVLLGLAGAGQARNFRGRAVPVYPVGPFVAMSITPDGLDLGEVGRSGEDSLSGRLTARIVANCPYHVDASFEPFTGKGGLILPEHTSLLINGRNVAAGGAPVSIASSRKPTHMAGVDVPVDLKVRVDRAFLYRSGAYEGTVTFTIMPGP